MWMVHGRRKATWTYLAEILALIVNVNRGKDTSPVSPDSINPYAHEDGPVEEAPPHQIPRTEFIRILAEGIGAQKVG